MYDGAVADAPTKLPITDLANREHLDAEHNVANAIVHFDSTLLTGKHNKDFLFLFSFYAAFFLIFFTNFKCLSIEILQQN